MSLKSTVSKIFFVGHRSSAGSRLLTLLLGSCLLSAALQSSHLLWLWSPRLTGHLGDSSALQAIPNVKWNSARGPLSRGGDQSQRRRDDRRAALTRQDPRKSTNKQEPAELLRPPKNSRDSMNNYCNYNKVINLRFIYPRNIGTICLPKQFEIGFLEENF